MKRIIVSLLAVVVVSACQVDSKKMQEAPSNITSFKNQKEISEKETSVISSKDFSFYKYNDLLNYKSISFLVYQKRDRLIIKPNGFDLNNDSVSHIIHGQVKNVLVDDIDGDDCPELFVSIEDSAKKVTIIGYSSNRNKSMSEVYCPLFNNNASELLNGYRGGDEFRLVENTFVQVFPLFKKDGNSFIKTGKNRQILYKLRRGEASKKIVYTRYTDY